eukprot:2601709-Rhodomonas_salina.2
MVDPRSHHIMKLAAVLAARSGRWSGARAPGLVSDGLGGGKRKGGTLGLAGLCSALPAEPEFLSESGRLARERDPDGKVDARSTPAAGSCTR